MDVNDNVKMAFVAPFPLPFHVLCLIGMRILGWATNLHGMALFGVDAVSALDIRSHDEHRSRTVLGKASGSKSLTYYTPIYRLLWSESYSLWSLLAWIIFRFATHGRLELVDACRHIAALYGLGVIGALVCPFEVFEKPERDMFLR